MQQAWYLYKPVPDRFDSALLNDEAGLVLRAHRLPFVGKSVLAQWTPVPVQMISDGTIAGDFPSLMDYYLLPLVTERAWRVLAPLIGPWVEALPVVAASKLYLLNVFETTDCIDHTLSEFDADEVSGRISVIWKYAFIEALMNDRDIIKTPRLSGAEVLVSERLRRAIEKADLRGLAFRPLPMSHAPTSR